MAISGIVGYFRSHPLPEERIHQIERIAAAKKIERPIVRSDQRIWMEKIVRRLSGRIPDDAHIYTFGNVAEVGAGKTVEAASGTRE